MPVIRCVKAGNRYLLAGLLLAFGAGGWAQTAADYSGQGEACFKKSDYNCAIENWKKAVSLAPALNGQLKTHLFRAYSKRAAEYYLNKDFEKAIADLSAALALDPGSEGIREAKAVAEKALKKSQEAAAPAQRPADVIPERADERATEDGFAAGWVLLFAVIALGIVGLGIWGFKKFMGKPAEELPAAETAAPVALPVESGIKPEEKPVPKSEPVPQPPAPVPSAEPAGGLVLANRYELKGTLGEGGMGVVLEAWDRQLKRKAAVKRMHSSLKEYPEEYARFRREAETVGKLRHPNIIGVHGIIEHAGEIYLVFDYIDGKSLAAMLKERKRFPLKDCKDILKGVCEAVHYAHKHNVIHRDLKPANIMLDTGGYAMVMDFGLASELRESFSRVSHQTMSGTPAYMAPEQQRGVVKRESDIYALGICLYEMLTGELPFPGYESLEQKKSGDYKPVSAHLPWLPAGLDAAVERALQPEPSQRYADALDFYDAFKDL